MRPKSTSRDLPPRLLRRKKRLKNGTEWVGFYYNGRDQNGNRIEIPLGSDLNEAKRKWAEFECKPAPEETGLMGFIFDRYERDIVPTKALQTQKDNTKELVFLRAVFNSAPINSITPHHIAQYRDNRKSKAKGAEGSPATTRANREIALFSHVFNMAREWGYTTKENPCRGVRKHKERPRDFYADDAVWNSVYSHASDELRDAMDLAYLTGQRPADVLKMTEEDLIDGALEVKQNKTKKHLRIMLDYKDGAKSELGILLDKIINRPRNSLYFITTNHGIPLTKAMLRKRFDKARLEAAKNLEAQNNPESKALALRIRKFQFRDIRPKAASETDLEHASKLLGHTSTKITETVYRRLGETVHPIR